MWTSVQTDRCNVLCVLNQFVKSSRQARFQQSIGHDFVFSNCVLNLSEPSDSMGFTRVTWHISVLLTVSALCLVFGHGHYSLFVCLVKLGFKFACSSYTICFRDWQKIMVVRNGARIWAMWFCRNWPWDGFVTLCWLLICRIVTSCMQYSEVCSRSFPGPSYRKGPDSFAKTLRCIAGRWTSYRKSPDSFANTLRCIAERLTPNGGNNSPLGRSLELV